MTSATNCGLHPWPFPYLSEYEVEYLRDSADLNDWTGFPHGISVLNTEEIKLFPVQHFIVKL